MKLSKGRCGSQDRRGWTFEEALTAVPYFSSVARSLRELYLEILAKRRELQTFAKRPGRPDCKALINEQEARRDLQKAEEEFEDALDELIKLEVWPLDPIQGTVLVPFVQDDQSAWYVFDLFDSQPIRSWRYQSDRDETRRALTASNLR
jgi:hypothetical protein